MQLKVLRKGSAFDTISTVVDNGFGGGRVQGEAATLEQTIMEHKVY